MSAVMSEAERFAEKKQMAVRKARSALTMAEERLAKALEDYEGEVARHEERGDGYFSASYHAARREAVLARKHLDAKRSALATAEAEAEAPVLFGGDPE